MIVVERSNCLPNIRVVDLKAGNFTQYHYIRFQENVYSLHLGPLISHVKYLTGHRYHSSHCQFIYTSFTQPQQVIDYDLDTRQKTVIHLERLADNYDKSHYESKRIFATGHDGTAVPVSLVYRRDLLGIKMIPRQLNPTLLHAYGAYGECVNPIFSLARISLLDRGFIFAVAHTRGGSEMGNRWYDEGRLSNKMNTFQDFCSVAEHLISEGYTQPSKLAIYGRSAGGLLIAAVINFAPQLFQAALTEVPFVDVITTMSDSSIPWTAFEYEVDLNNTGMGKSCWWRYL